VLDVLTGVLPYEVSRMAQTRIVLLRAVRTVGGRFDADPGQVIDALRRDSSEHPEHAGVVADFLDEMRERMALLIPETDADPYAETHDAATKRRIFGRRVVAVRPLVTGRPSPLYSCDAPDRCQNTVQEQSNLPLPPRASEQHAAGPVRR
jgi:hypothetical protein